MAKSDKNPNEIKGISPKGRFKFPKLFKPDTKFKEEGEYSVKLILTEEEAAPLLAKLEPLHEIAEQQGRAKYSELPVASRKKLDAKGGFTINPLFSPIYDDQENETGEIEFKFASKASGVSKKTGKPWTRKLDIFDARGKLIKEEIEVWGGSLGKVAYTAYPYFIPGTGAAGVSLRLESAQIIELRQGGDRSAAGYGFGEEDGFDSSETEGSGHGFADESESANTEDTSDF